MAEISVKSLTELGAADSVAATDLLHLGQGSGDKSTSFNQIQRLFNNAMFPVGIIEFFAVAADPNSMYPGQSWRRFTEGTGRMIRIASESGDNIGQAGGDDSRVIPPEALPRHSHHFNRPGGEYGRQYIKTGLSGYHSHGGAIYENGNHNHQDGWGAPGGNWSGANKGTNNDGWHGFGWTSTGGGHQHALNIDGNGTHQHYVRIQDHNHNYSGNSGYKGSNQATNFQNAYVKLAAWIRES